MQSLDDPNPLIRYRAARVLARIGPDALEAVPALVRHLNDVDISVRREAARALGQIGPQAAEAVPPLIEALKSDEAP
jgi:HEAT repeat protein